MIPQEVRDLAAGIADDIERNGHYQGIGTHWSNKPQSRTGPGEPCCLIACPSFWKAPEFRCSALTNVLYEQVDPSREKSLLYWNDQTPTAEVLATLRKIAAGETP